MPRQANNTQSAQGGGTEIPGVTIIASGVAPESRKSKVDDGETNAFVMRLVGRYGSSEAALVHLAGEQLKYRRRAQDAEEHAKDLQAQIPAQGSVVLTGDAATAYQKVVVEGKLDVSKLPDQLKELVDLRSTRGKESRQADIARAADPDQQGEPKYKVKVLERLLGDTPLEFKKKNVRDEESADGVREVSIAYVKLEGGKIEELDSWLEREHEDFWEIVQVTPEESDGEGEARTPAVKDARSPASSSRNGEPRVPAQRSSNSGTGGGKKKGDAKETLAVVDRVLSSQYMTPGQRAKADAGKK